MAEQKQAADQENSRAGEAVKPASLGARVADLLGKAWDFVTGDKYINAMARQGANELGSALKAFPDSVAEYRWVHSDDNDSAHGQDSHSVGRAPWPSEIAEANRIAPPGNSSGRDLGNDQGRDSGYSM